MLQWEEDTVDALQTYMVTTVFLLYFYSPNGNNEGRN